MHSNIKIITGGIALTSSAMTQLLTPETITTGGGLLTQLVILVVTIISLFKKPRK